MEVDKRTSTSPRDLLNLAEKLRANNPELFTAISLLGSAVVGIQGAVRAAMPTLTALANFATPATTKLMATDWTGIQAKLEGLPMRSKAAMRLAVAKGWFFGWHGSLGDVFSLIERLETTTGASIDGATIDQIFEQYFLQNFEALTAELVTKYPHRGTAIAAAALAHQATDFEGAYVSVPVFIAQADGLLSELLGIRSIFMKGGRTDLDSRIAQWTAADSKLEGMLEPFAAFEGLDLLLGPSQREAHEAATGHRFTALNRHQVMHGESAEYGTPLNSLKAFSLLAFVGLHVPQVLGMTKSQSC